MTSRGFEFASASGRSINFCFTFAHCMQQERLQDSRYSLSTIMRHQRRERRPVCLSADFNVDLLPAAIADPWASLPSRIETHRKERESLSEFIAVNRGKLAVPTSVHDSPGGDFQHAWNGNPFLQATRVPFGSDQGIPSHLDHTVLVGCRGNTRIHWDGSTADHAIVENIIFQSTLAKKEMRQSKWRCGSDTLPKRWYEAHWDHFDSLDSFLQFWKEGQDRFASKKSSRERRMDREPPGIKALRAELRSCQSNQVRKRLLAEIRQGQAHWLHTLKIIRQRKGLKLGRGAVP